MTNEKRPRHRGLALLCAMSMSVMFMPGAQSALESDDVGMYGSILISRKAHSAAASMKRGDYAAAQQAYRALIGLNPKVEDFYFGLYDSSYKLKQWDQVTFALEQLFQLRPKYKNKMVLEYGECLYHMNRYSDAEPMLKLALTKINEPSIVENKLKKLMRKSIIIKKKQKGRVIIPVKKKPKPKPPPRKVVKEEEVHAHTSKYSLTLDNAYKSESIVIAEYKGFEHDGPVTYYRPPLARYRIIEYLKGPPLNRSLPIRFEFHQKVGESKPKGWKFDKKAMMPKKGSKWIIFIQNAVPIDGMFETYHGSYGRKEYNEQNLDEILAILERHKGQTR